MRDFYIHHTLIFCAALVFASPATAERLNGPIPAKVIHVVDGDTLKVRAQIWLHQSINISVRLRGIDAPELDGNCATERILAQQAHNRLNTLVSAQGKSGLVNLKNISSGKYSGRVIATVETMQGMSVGDVLLKEKVARPYKRRQSKSNWCRLN